MKPLLLVLSLAVAGPAGAQGLDTLGQWPVGAQPAWDVASTGTAYASIGKAVWDDLRGPNQAHDLTCTGLKLVPAVLVPMGLKALFPRARPDGSDNKAFPSQHSSVSAAMIGGPRLALAFTLTGATGYGRVAAGKHHWTDVFTGWAIGGASDYLIQRYVCDRY